MASPFSRTLRSIDGDSASPLWATVLAGLLISSWGTWFVVARVPLRAISSEARLALEPAVIPLEVSTPGTVTELHLELGAEVREGDLLAVQDRAADEIERARQHRRRQALRGELLALQRQILAQEDSIRRADAAIESEEAERTARVAVYELDRTLAEEELERTRQLRERGGASAQDLSRARATARKATVVKEAETLAAGRKAQESLRQRSERHATLEQLKRDEQRLMGELASTASELERIRHLLTTKEVRAPTHGWIAEIADVSVGEYLTAGESLGAVLLDGDVRIVAMFEPAEVLGRVHAGQSGTLRVEGRTSTPLRSIRGRVERVGRELRDGLVRVELVLEATPEASRLAQHGLRGTVEIEVERVSPAELVLRAAGRLVAP